MATHLIVRLNKLFFEGLPKNRKLNYIDVFFLFTLSIIFFNYFYKHIILYSHPDIGWIRSLIYRNPLQLLQNQSYKLDWQSGWEFHYSLFLSIISLLSFLWPFGAIKWLSLFFTLQVVLIYYPVLRIAQNYFVHKGTIKEKILINTLAIPLSLGGSITGSLLFPHYELYQVVFFIWVLYGILLSNKLIVLVSGFLFLSIREDSFLYAGVIFLILGAILRAKAFYLAAAVVLFVFLLQLFSRQLLFDTPSIFRTDYLGEPTLSHINLSHFLARGELIIENNYPIFITFYLIIFVGIWQLNKSVLLNSIILIPLLLMGMFSFSPAKGSFILYYSIPFFYIYFPNILLILRANLIRFQRVFCFFICMALSISIPQNDFYILQVASTKIPSGYSEKAIEGALRDAILLDYPVDSTMYAYGPEQMNHGMYYSLGTPVTRCIVVPKFKVAFYIEQNSNLLQTKFKDYEQFYKLCPALKN
jgi:hypothetical protein